VSYHLLFRKKPINLKGQLFGRLRVLSYAGVGKNSRTGWLCRCKCGTKKVVTSVSLRCGFTKSCGCLRADKRGKWRLLNLKGKRFGRLVAVRRCEKEYKTTCRWWVCRCDCGNTVRLAVSTLRGGFTKSCGCYKKGPTSLHWKHGGSSLHKRELNSYVGMKQRCLNEKSPNYEGYGGRGITICERWLGENGFVNFLMDMGPRPEGTSLDRINVMGNYELKNCRWADSATQHANRRCMMTDEEIAELKRVAEMEERLTAAYYSGGEAAF
jgi:hypothetical protein